MNGENKGIRLLAIDLDGTLLTGSKQLTDRTAAALRQAISAGLQVVPVTGRPLGGMPSPLMDIPGIRYVISSNGAVTTDLSSGQHIRTAMLDRETAAAIAEIPVSRGLIHDVFIDGLGYCEQAFYDLQWAFFRDKPPAAYVKQSRRVTDNLGETIRQAREGIENIWIMAGSTQERDEIDRMIRAAWPVQTVLTAARDVEVGSPDADKGKAILDLAGRLGIGREGILAMGDNENDLSMLLSAGTAVAMGNAPESVRLAAGYVTDTNENDGAARVIEQLLLRHTE